MQAHVLLQAVHSVWVHVASISGELSPLETPSLELGLRKQGGRCCCSSGTIPSHSRTCDDPEWVNIQGAFPTDNLVKCEAKGPLSCKISGEAAAAKATERQAGRESVDHYTDTVKVKLKEPQAGSNPNQGSQEQ